MNENDSEIVRSLLSQKYVEKDKVDADIVFLMHVLLEKLLRKKFIKELTN